VSEPRRCLVHFDGWGGRVAVPAECLGEARRCGRDGYKVRLLEAAYQHAAGKVLYPPRFAVTFPGEVARE